MNNKTRLFHGPPVASIEAMIEVYPAAVFVLFHLTTRCFPQLCLSFSKPVYYSFVVMLAGLCSLAKKQTAHSIANGLGIVSHDALTRFLKHQSWDASTLITTLLNLAISMATVPTIGLIPTSYLILDDVIIPKPFARLIGAAYYDWDYVNRRKVFCQRLVVLVWTNGVFVLPVAFALWHKKNSNYLVENNRRYRTKNEIARCLIHIVVRSGLSFNYITFDSWYASKENLNLLTRLGVIYYTAIPCDRKIERTIRPLSVVSGQPATEQNIRCNQLAKRYKTRDFTPYRGRKLRAISFFVDITGLNHGARLVIVRKHGWIRFLNEFAPQDKESKKKEGKDPNKYLLTNRVFGEFTYDVIVRYRSRWTIEVMFRDLKQHLGLMACQHRDVEAINRHFALSMFAYVCLQYLRQEQLQTYPDDQKIQLTIGDVKKHLQSQCLVQVGKINSPGIVKVAQKPMPREVFEVITDSTNAKTISNGGFLMAQLTDFKELKNIA